MSSARSAASSARSVTAVPNDLEAYWVPFTPNRAFKQAPRLVARAKDMHYITTDGRQVLDATAGLWCCNAGHNREPIVAAIQAQAGELDYAPAFQFSHVKAFGLASRISALAPADLDHVLGAVHERVVDRLAHEHAAHRHCARGDAFGKRDEVRHDAVALGGEGVTEPAEAGDHLVEDE